MTSIANLPPVKLLFVEDQRDLADNLLEFFESDRHVIDFAADGLTALHLLATQTYDVIVLDIMLPGVDGFEICERIRRDLKCATPVILVTALGTLQDKERGFACGADDYLVKPFDLRELHWRINALLRRHHPRRPVLQAGALRFDPGSLELKLNDRHTSLSGTSARLFELLIRAYPDYLDHHTLMHALWGDEHDDLADNSLRTHVYTLRKAIKSALDYDPIRTVHGRGYRLQPPDGTPQASA